MDIDPGKCIRLNPVHGSPLLSIERRIAHRDTRWSRTGRAPSVRQSAPESILTPTIPSNPTGKEPGRKSHFLSGRGVRSRQGNPEHDACTPPGRNPSRSETPIPVQKTGNSPTNVDNRKREPAPRTVFKQSGSGSAAVPPGGHQGQTSGSSESSAISSLRLFLSSIIRELTTTSVI